MMMIMVMMTCLGPVAYWARLVSFKSDIPSKKIYLPWEICLAIFMRVFFVPMKFLVTSAILADFFRYFLQAISINMFLLKLRQIIIR